MLVTIQNMMLHFSPGKRCPCPCSDTVLRSCQEALAGIILHRPPFFWCVWVPVVRDRWEQGRPGAPKAPPPQWFPPPPRTPVVASLPPLWCGVVWFGCGLWWFPPCGMVWVGWFPLHVWICLGCLVNPCS